MKISIASLRAAGVSAELILVAMEMDTEDKRAKETTRKAQYRSRVSHMSRDVPYVPRDIWDKGDKQDQQLGAEPIQTNQERDSKEDALRGSKNEIVRKKERKEVRVISTRGDPKLFDQFFAAYPHRKGTNPRKPAEDKFWIAVKSGADPEAIIAGAVAYDAAMRADGKIGTEYVKQAMTWLNQQCWRDYLEKPLAEPIKGGTPPGCRSSEEILAEIQERKRAQPRDFCGLSDEGHGVYPELEKNGAGPLFCDQAGNGGMGRLESLLSEAVSAVTVGNVRRS